MVRCVYIASKIVNTLSCTANITANAANNRATLIREAANMPKNVAEVDCHFDKALGFLLKYQNMAIPDDDKASEGDKRGKGSASHDNSTINL